MAAEFTNGYVTRYPAWHGLATVLECAPTAEDAIVAAGLDWIVEKKEIFDSNGALISGYYANTKMDDGKVLGVVSGRYEIVQNRDAFSFTDSLVGEGLEYESAGALRDSKVVWLLGKMPKTQLLGEDLEPYVAFVNSFDGSGAIQVCLTPTRVCCMNTLNLALSTAKRKWSTRHIGDMQSKLVQAQMTLGLINEYTDALRVEAERLAQMKFTDADVEGMLDILYSTTEEDSDIRKKRVQKLKDNFFYCLQAPDVRPYKNTAYAAIMAATDYADHGEPMRKTKNFEENRWFNVMQGHPFVNAVYKQIAA